MKKISIMIIAVCMLPVLSGNVMSQEAAVYGLPDFYVRTNPVQDGIEYLNSASSAAYTVGEIPGGEILHVTDLVYSDEDNIFWALVSYEGITGWVDLAQTFILRGTTVSFPEERDAAIIAGSISEEVNREKSEMIVFVSVEEELELKNLPGEINDATVVAVVTNTMPLYYYGEEYLSGESEDSWLMLSTSDGKAGWVRADQVIMAGSQMVLEEKEREQEEESRKQQEEASAAINRDTDTVEMTEEPFSESAEIMVYNPDYTGSYVNYDEGRIIIIREDEIINRVFDPDTWEQISETSYYYVARRASLRAEQASEESSRMIAFNNEDASDIWILFYDPYAPDMLQEEYKTGEKPSEEGTKAFSRTENQ